MKSKVKELIQIRMNTMRKKMLGSFSLVMILMILVSSYTYISGKKLIDLYDGLLENHLLLNDLFVSLGEANVALVDYLHDDTEEMYLAYESHQQKLTHSVSVLNSRNNSKYYRRELIDLGFMIDSYLDEANLAIQYDHEENLSESNQHFYLAQNIAGLVNETFTDVYSMILKDTNQIKLDINNNRRKQFTYSGILIFLIGLFSILLVRWFTDGVTKPIKQLTEVVSNFSKGDEKLQAIPITSNDEVRILSSAFNEMIFRINRQIEELVEKNRLERMLTEQEVENLKIKNMLKESELRVLQSRINPHFLFNSLNIISQMSYLEGAEQTTSLLESMADFLRYNLDKFNKVVTIEDEMGNVKDYCTIQYKRFGDRIRFLILDDEEANLAQIPCLILQPLVENAVIHGVGSYTERGHIDVCVKRQESRVILSVADNGVGINSEKLKVIRTMTMEEGIPDEQEGIGLRNVIARLKLFYQSDVTIEVRSAKSMGTEIRIDLPYWEKEVEDV